MRWVDAGAIVAGVAHEHTFGDGAIMKFIAKPMRVSRGAIDMKHAIARRSAVRLPFPTRIRIALVDGIPESNDGWRVFAMMPRHKWNRLALNPSATVRVAFCDTGFLSASALAKTVGNILRGIIGVHGKLPFLCLIRERFQSLPGVFVCSTRVIIPQERA